SFSSKVRPAGLRTEDQLAQVPLRLERREGIAAERELAVAAALRRGDVSPPAAAPDDKAATRPGPRRPSARPRSWQRNKPSTTLHGPRKCGRTATRSSGRSSRKPSEAPSACPQSADLTRRCGIATRSA